jgi:ribonuclease III
MSVNDYSSLLNPLKLKFNDPALLETAFTHRSYLNEYKEAKHSNERLEFLGDCVLAYIISSYLFERRPNDTEGDLTNLRSYIVKTKSLADAALKLDLGSYLLLSKGEELSGGRQNTQLLANTFEAFLGSVFLDQGIETAQRVVHAVLLPDFQDEINSGPPKDSKSALQEVVQNKSKKSPHYKILQTFGPDHAKEFVVGVFVEGLAVGEGRGSSKQAAEEAAAAEALDKLSK